MEFGSMCSIIQNVVIQTIIYDKCAWYLGNFLCNCIFFFLLTHIFVIILLHIL